jgi:hypothetical protein
MRRLLAARATARARPFIPSAATAAARGLTGRTIAGTSDPRLNAALVMLCNLQAPATTR